MSRYQKAKLKYFIKTVATVIILIAVLIVGIVLITAPDKAARERFGDGTCQSCGDAKYKAVGIDRHGYTVYECPECYDNVKIYKY